MNNGGYGSYETQTEKAKLYRSSQDQVIVKSTAAESVVIYSFLTTWFHLKEFCSMKVFVLGLLVTAVKRMSSNKRQMLKDVLGPGIMINLVLPRPNVSFETSRCQNSKKSVL